MCAEDFEDTTTYEEFKLSGSLFSEELQLEKKDHYKTGDLCKMLEINERTYRTWEERGWFPQARRDRNGFRVFDAEELVELKSLFSGRARRFKGAKRF